MTALETPARRRMRPAPYVLIVPTLVVLIAALGYPLVWQIVTSLQHFGLAQQFGQPAQFVGLGNYIALASDPGLWIVVGRSLLFCAVCAALTMLVGTLLALVMRTVPAAVRVVLQIALLLAWAMPVVASMTVFTWLVDWRRGVLNWLLTAMGLPFDQHNWLQSPLSFYGVGVVIVVWMSVPFVAFSIFASLTQVPDEVIEAAEMDGARPGQRFWSIVVPIIRPVLSIVLLLQVIWDLRVFTQVKMLQDAGSIASQTNLLGTYIYGLGVGSSDFGNASAVSILVLVITIAISAVYVRQMIKEER